LLSLAMAAKGIHGLPKVHPDPPCTTLIGPAGRPPPKRPYKSFRGSQALRAGGLWPFSTPSDTPGKWQIMRLEKMNSESGHWFLYLTLSRSRSVLRGIQAGRKLLQAARPVSRPPQKRPLGRFGVSPSAGRRKAGHGEPR
jgi:hypothetical protein